MKRCNDMSGTSFHGSEIVTTVNKLKKILGEPLYDDNSGSDKTNFDWCMKYGNIVFTVYDWKEYRPLDLDEEICFHIGGHSKSETESIRSLLQRTLDESLFTLR